MMTRAAAAMVKLEMQSDELARFLVATIGTSTHSPDAIAKSFELRDPVGPVPLRTENVRSHIEIAVGAGGAAAAHGSCHGERPEMQARELADLRISNAGGSWLTPPLCFQEASAGGDREAAHDGPGDAIACAATGPASTSGEPGCSLSQLIQRCDRPNSALRMSGRRLARSAAGRSSRASRSNTSEVGPRLLRQFPLHVWQPALASLRLRGFGSPQIRCGGSRSTTPCSCSGCRKSTRRASTCPTSCGTYGCSDSSANDLCCPGCLPK